MPTDQAHGRNIPSGYRLAQALREVFNRQLAEAVQRLRSGNTEPLSFDRWTGPMVSAFLPIVQPIYVQAASVAWRRIQTTRPKVSRGISCGITPTFSGGVALVLKRKPPIPAFDVFNPRVTDYLQDIVFHFVDEANRTTSDRLRAALSEGLQAGETPLDLTRRIQTIFRDPFRSQTIAMTEASRAHHGGELIAAKESGVVSQKKWLASSDACDVCLGLAGKTVDLDDNFAVIGKGPYAAILHPPAHPRCMCAMTEVLG